MAPKTAMKPELSIVIPCFNEAINVITVLEKFKVYLAQHPLKCEVVVVDGNSSDNTPEELEKIFKTLDKDIFKVHLLKQRGGYGKDIMHGVHSATGDVIAWTHADMQTDPYDVFKAYDVYKSSTENQEKIFVKGKRKNRRFMEAFFTFGMQVVTFFVLGKYLDDINAQPKVFSRAFYEAHLKEGYPEDFSLDLFALYKATSNGYKIKTLPVFFAKREHGEAKGGGGGWKARINLIKRTFTYIFKLKKIV